MSYESRTYDNGHGDPVVVLVVTGQHDVSRFANWMNGRVPTVEIMQAGEKILRQVKRHNGGRAALALLKEHGGPDFTATPEETVKLIRLAISDPGAFVKRRRFNDDDYETLPAWCTRAVLAALYGEEVPS
ncbi:hypothetical protein [Actinomadura formosensis]|uniref:hypothetical protein n=1 Tax=Actinomadura formosensis TaxID=60706 RepID=UPI003D92FED0